MSTDEKILIIESDATVGQGLVTALQDDGFYPIWAKTGTEGLKMMFDLLPRLIFLDVTLPDIDGYEILEKKQAEPILAKVPVFLLSSQGEPINMQNIPQGSVTEFLMAIHSDPKDVLVKINALLRPGRSASPVPSKGKEKKILWVEDDKLIGTILAKKIVSSGFELFHAKNGEEALEIIGHETPDVIVVDLLLPGMSGFDILQKIQMDPTKKSIPTMVLSNLSKPSDIEKAKVLGAKKFLVKAATSLDQIVAEIKELCN